MYSMEETETVASSRAFQIAEHKIGAGRTDRLRR